MRLLVFRISIMYIVCNDKRNPGLPRHAEKRLVHCLLLGNAVILKLQEEIPFTEQLLIPKRGLFPFLIHPSCNIALHFSCKTGA